MTWTEDERLNALRQQAILDTPEEESFDEIVRAAAQAFNAPMAAVSLVDRDRQWFKAHLGLGMSETPRDVSFCAHAINGEALLIVPDATADPRFVDNALVTEDPALRFYAGALIRTEAGIPLGALCVIDTVARPGGISEEQAILLQTLADQVSEQLRLRRLVAHYEGRAAVQSEVIQAGLGREDRLLRALHSGAVGWWEWDIPADRVVGNPELARDFGVDPKVAVDGAPIDYFFANVHPLDRQMLIAAVHDAIETGAPFREEYRIIRPDGTAWVSARGSCLFDDAGQPSCFPGVIVDITDRKEAERRLREADLRREIAMGAAQLGSWDHDPSAGVRRHDARALELFGLATGENQDIANVLATIHPDDRERVRLAIDAACKPGRTGPFRETFRVVDRATGDQRWLSAVGRSQFHHGICTRFIGVLDDVTEQELAQEHHRLLANELNHRVKNNLAVVSSIINASLRGAVDLTSARQEITRRLQTLSNAHDLLTATSWISAEIAAVVDQTVEALGLPRDRIETGGAAIALAPKSALQLALALHELGTNAVKYGALANDTGRVRIAWGTNKAAGGMMLRIEWIERGGPPVAAPIRRGFGTRLIERATAAEFRGDSTLDYAPTGLRWTLEAPLAPIETDGAEF